MSLPRFAFHGRTFALLALAATAAAYARFTVSPLQEAMRAALTLSDRQMAMLQGPALALPMVIAGLPIGLLIDRVSRARLILAFSVIECLGTTLTALAPNYPVLIVARCLVGLAVPAICTAVFSLVGDLYGPTQRGRACMAIVIGQYVGLSGAFALGGSLMGLFGAGHDGWRPAMLGLASVLLPVALLMFWLQEPARQERVVGPIDSKATLKELWQFRAIIAVLVTGVLMGDIGVYGVLSWAAPAFSRQFSTSPQRTGEILGLAVLISGIAGPLIGGLIADFTSRSGGTRRTVVALGGLAALSIPTGAFCFVPHLAAATLMLVAYSTAGSAILVAGTALFTVAIPNEIRGTCVAVSFAIQSLLGIALVPVLISLLSEALGGERMLGAALSITCVGVSILGVGIFGLGSRFFPKR